jgi:hypothetical protein
LWTYGPIRKRRLPNLPSGISAETPKAPAIGAAAVALGPSFGVVAVAAHGVGVAVDAFGKGFSLIENIVKSVANAVIPVINSIGDAVSSALAPMRVMIDAANLVPGVSIPQIPDYTHINQLGGTPAAAGGGPGAQAERRGTGTTLPNAGIATPGAFGTPGGIGGSIAGSAFTQGGWGDSPYGVAGPSGGGGGGGSTTSERDKIRASLDPNAFLPAGMTGGGGGDSSLLANVPAGKYVDPGGTFDLSQGLADCSSAVGDLVKTMDGQPTGGADRLNTGNASTWLPAHGFLPNATGANVPGAMNVGYDPAHMQATLPGGTNFNWGSDSAAARGGVGGTGAFDPAFTSHYYRPANGANAAYGAPGYVDQAAVTDAKQGVWKTGYDLQQSKMDEAVLGKDPTATGLEKSAAHEKTIEDGWAYQKALDKLSEAQAGTWKKMSNAANQSSDGMQQIGSKLDDDFGVSKGLPGIFENVTKMLANLAMAPVIGALSGVTAANGTAGTGTGLLGMLAPRTNAAGQAMPNVFGQYPAAKDGQPGYTPPGAASLLPPGISPTDTVPTMLSPGEVVVPAGDAATLQNMGGMSEGGKVGGNGGGHGGPVPRTPAAPPKASATPGGGRAAPAPGHPGGPPITPLAPPGAPGGIGGPGGPAGGKLPGPVDQKAGPTSTRDTAQRGITQGEGLPASEGLGIGGGLIGAAESAGPAAAGMGGGGAAASAGAQIGIDELNRAIGMGAQAAGIGVEGLMQTFLPVESELGDPMRGWFGKGLGAVAGIRPAAKNVAGGLTDKILGTGPDKGQQAALTPEQAAAGRAQNTDSSSTDNSISVNVTGMPNDQAGQATKQAIDHATYAQNAMAGGR